MDRARGVATAAAVEVLGAESGKLSEQERTQLEAHEKVIEAGLKTFIEVGAALHAIRDGRLYRTSHATFEAYCDERWGFSRQRANQLISGAAVVASLGEGMTTRVVIPSSEYQIRALAGLGPDQMCAAWQRAVDRAGGPPSGRQVEAAVAELFGRAADAAIEEVVAEQGDEDAGGEESPRPPAPAAAAPGLAADEADGEGGDFGADDDDFDPAPAAVPIRGGAAAGSVVTEDRMDDERWLRQATVREKLANPRLFDQEAIRWRRLRKALGQFLDALRALGLSERRRETQGPLTALLLRTARIPHPWSWMLCGTCMGRGAVADRGTCPHCRGGGFQLG